MICEFRLWYRGEERRCGRVTAVRVWYDSAGTLHAACGSHIAEIVHRYPEAPAPDPAWLDAELLRRAAELVTWTDAGYGPGEYEALE